MRAVIYTDGGARGNPGPAAIGVAIYRVMPKASSRGAARRRGILLLKARDSSTPLRSASDDESLELVEKFGRYIGETTNNQAEYRAILAALERAAELKAREVDMFMDSELAVRQLNRQYKVRNAALAALFVKIWNEAIHFKQVRFHHIPREQNKVADKMVNEAIDAAGLSPAR